MKRPFRPNARRAGLLIERLDDETLVYDKDSHRAHCLNGFASRLWDSCTGAQSIGQMARAEGWSDAVIIRGLEDLANAGLLHEPPPKEPTRRRALAQLGRVAAIPAVVSILVPDAAAAASCVPFKGSCGTDSSLCCAPRCCAMNGMNAGTCIPAGASACF